MEEKPFGRSIRRRRRELDLTQEELARRVGCAAITIRKIEAEAARPSVQISERLAMALAIPLADRAEFVRCARSIHPDAAEIPTPPLSPRDVGSEDLSGRAIRGYALGEKIGSGGMGAVYRATQPTFEREVAIKIILPRYANHPDFIRRFETEAQLVARLEHPHIVPLYDYWREPGVAYLVMRLLRGGNLRSLIEEHPLTLETVSHMMEQIGSALIAAHRIGVIHRDLKPANILLDEDQNAYLADFGIAKNLSSPDDGGPIKIGVPFDSPKYLSPEQIRSVLEIPQSDIYCLGVMLYEMLTGKLPYVGPTPIDFIKQHIFAPMPALSANRSGLPAALDIVIGRATAKEPEDRYADVSELLGDFRLAVGELSNNIRVQLLSEQDNIQTAEVSNPYKGLRAFLEADADDFFGRETLVQQLLARMGEGGDLFRFLAVIGPSGSGKSSAVKAGLLPALKRGGLVGSENWFYTDFTPGINPFIELEAALLRVAINPPQGLIHQLKQGERGLIRAVKRILPSDPSVELVIVVDQFEELFTLVESEEERSLFLENIVSASLDENSRMRILVTLRADFISQPLCYLDFGELIQRRNEFVLPLTPDELERAIVNPARRVGLKFESGLVPMILSDLGNQPGNLPLLQYGLTELYERRDGRMLSKRAYADIGGISGALIRRTEEVFTGLSQEHQEIAHQLFLRLVTIGEGVEETRRRVLRMELEQLQGKQEGNLNSLNYVIAAFSKYRLLTFDYDPVTRSPTVEVAHEALLREWTRLRGWLIENNNHIRLQRQLASAVREWQDALLDEGFLLTGARLSQYEDWDQLTDVALTQNEREYLQASFLLREKNLAALAEQEAREEKLRQRAQSARQEALRQASIGLATQAMSELNGTNPERAVLLALEALEKYPYTWQAERALGLIISKFRLRHIIVGHTDTVMDVGWSPDGSKFATTAKDGTLRIWDAETRDEIINIAAHHSLEAGYILGGTQIVWSPDGTRIASAGLDRIAIVWDVVSGKKIAEFTGHTDGVLDIAWSADGKWVATAGKDGTAKVWNAESGEERFEFSNHTGIVRSIDWSPNGIMIASTSDDATVRIWDAQSGIERFILKGHANTVWKVAWSHNGDRLATTGEDGTLRIWDAQTWAEIKDIRSAHPIWDVAWSPDDCKLATTGADGIARVWDVASGKEVFTLQGQTLESFRIAWSPDGYWLATTAGAGFTIRIWDAKPFTKILSGTQAGMGWVSWSPDSRRLATAAEDGTVVIWDAKFGEPLLQIQGHTKNAEDVFWSPDGLRVVSTGWDNLAKVWDANTGEELVTFSGHVGEPVPELNKVDCLFGDGYSPDGSRIMTQGGNGSVRIWDSQTGEEFLVFNTTKDVSACASWSPDGRRIASCVAPGELQMWDAETGESIYGGYIYHEDILRVDTPDLCMMGGWSPDGTRILTASWAGNGAVIWDAKTGEKLLVFKNHTGGIGFSTWSPNGERIATGDTNGEVKVWDAQTGNELLSFQLPVGAYLFQLDWSPDGAHLAGAGLLDSIEIFRVWQSKEDLIAYTRACCVIRDLTQDERQQFGILEFP